MTTAQIQLLQRVIRSEMRYWRCREHPLPRRECEVMGPEKRTARSLVDAGLLDYAGSDNPHQTWVKLPIDLIDPEDPTPEVP